MYSTYGRNDYNHMEIDKENQMASVYRNSKNQGFETPIKSREAFMTFEDAFHTPATVFGQRNNSEFGTPFQNSVSRGPIEFGESPNIKHFSFEELPCFDPNVQASEIMNKIKASFSGKNMNNWIDKYDSINMLRALNKHFSDEIFEIFVQFGDEIVQCFNIVNSQIQRNILLFIAEVFKLNQPKKNLDESIIRRLIPFLLMKALSSHKELKEISKFSLELVTKEFICNSSIITFCELCFEKNLRMNDISFRMLGYSIQNLGDNIRHISAESLRAIFTVFSKYIHGRGGRITNHCIEGAKYMCSLMSFDNYVSLLKDIFEKKMISVEEANHMVNIINEQSKVEGRTKYEIIRKEIKQTKRKNKCIGGGDIQIIDLIADKKTMEKEKIYSQSSGQGQGWFHQNPSTGVSSNMWSQNNGIQQNRFF